MEHATWAQPALEVLGESRTEVGRTCTRCGEWKPAEAFVPRKGRGGKLSSSCRECLNASHGRPWRQCGNCGKRFRSRHDEEIYCSARCVAVGPKRDGGRALNPVVNGLKTCSRCGETKPKWDFPNRPGGRPGLAARCKACKSEVELTRMRRITQEQNRLAGVDRDAPLINNQGYVLIKMPEHPRASASGRVLEHIAVAEAKYGFAITEEFTVHHRNNDKTDNRPENLELRVGDHGVGGDVLPTLLRHAEERADAVAELLNHPQYRAELFAEMARRGYAVLAPYSAVAAS